MSNTPAPALPKAADVVSRWVFHPLRQSIAPRNSFQRGNQVSSAHTGCHGRAIHPGRGHCSRLNYTQEG